MWGLALHMINSQLRIRELNTSVRQWYTDQTAHKKDYFYYA